MRKIAITLSLATLLLGGIAGCGTDQQGTGGLGGQDQRGMGYHTTDTQPGTGITGQRAGEGPITDMFTRDDRRGARGFGRDTRSPATGLAGERGITGQRGVQGRHGMTGQFGTDGVGGMTGRGHGAGEGVDGGIAGRGGMTGAGAGRRGTQFISEAGIDGLGADGVGAGMRYSEFGGVDERGGMTGEGVGMGSATGRRGTTGAGIGGAGTRNGMRSTQGLGETGIAVRDHGKAGIVGNNRAGYVDDRGILRGRGTTGRTGIGGLGQNGRNLQDNRTGVETDVTGQTGRQGATGITGTRGTGMNQFGYHTGYDGAMVQSITTRLADVENVRDSRVIVNKDRVLIGIDANGQDSQRIEQDVRRTVENMVGDKEVIIVTERDQYDQVRTVDDRLRGGEAFEEVGSTVNEMFRDFGRAIQRPFERTR